MVHAHFVPSQPNAINMLRHKRLDTGNKQTGSKRLYGVLKAVWDLARLFGKRTTIHGLNHLLGETEGRFERTIWLLTVISAFFGSIYVCLILSRRFNEGKFQTVVDSTRMPVYKIVFPVITICNLNRLNWARIDEAKQKFLPNETSSEKLKIFEKIVGSYDDIEFANFDKFAVLEGLPLESLNHINFSLVVNFMTWRCEEFLDKCVWRHKPMNCCEIFSKRRSKSGLCWAFNTLETDEGRRMKRLDPMWPWRTGAAGPTSALQVRVLINPDKHYPKRVNEKGLSVMVTEPLVWQRTPLRVFANTETMMDIEPVIFFYDNDTRSISSDQRQCVFENEHSSSDFKSLQNYVYMIENCQSECHQEHLMRYCNCSVDLLFPPGQFPPCKAKDLLCLAKNNAHFQHSYQPGEKEFVRSETEGMRCKCFRNCYSLKYIPDGRSSFLSPEVRGNASYVDLDAHFRFDTMMVYRTSMVFGWVDLMVAFGGIAGLFLGCSLISGIELAYFAFIEMPFFVCKRIGCGRQPLNQAHNMNTSSKYQNTNQMLYGGKQWNEFVLRNNISRKISEEKRYAGLQPRQLVTWNR